ncbi:uncharacterized protein PAF06_014162 [Gastrophryne carolinensis]
MAKTDIESAFRLLPVHPDSLYLLGCFFEGGYYVDRCLPMGCSISCAYFEAFSSFLEWVVKERAGMGSVTHYLDDFLCVGPAGTRICHLLLSTMLDVFGVFGVPVAHDKTEGPATVMKFLGIEIDTVGRVCRLPRDKIEDLVGGLEGALGVKKVTLVQLQSLLGKLNFACRVLPMGRVFTRRLSLATAGVREPHHFIRIDYILVSHDLLPHASGSKIKQITISDHAPSTLSVQWREVGQREWTWWLSESLLHNEMVVQEIQKGIKDYFDLNKAKDTSAFNN